MIRRILRIAVAAFCLLSLLAALGVAWLWWEARHGRGYVAEGAVGGTYVILRSEPSDVRVAFAVIRGWPGRRFVRAEPYREQEQHPLFWELVSGSQWQKMGLSGQTGDDNLLVAPMTGEPVRWIEDHLSGTLLPVRSWSLAGVPHQGLIVVTLMPPLLWAGVRWRRLRERRRRVRLGLCLACGYDLRESREKCPECGAVAVAAPAAVRAGSARIR